MRYGLGGVLAVVVGVTVPSVNISSEVHIKLGGKICTEVRCAHPTLKVVWTDIFIQSNSSTLHRHYCISHCRLGNSVTLFFLTHIHNSIGRVNEILYLGLFLVLSGDISMCYVYTRTGYSFPCSYLAARLEVRHHIISKLRMTIFVL